MIDLAFRRALGEFATGVAVVTAQAPSGVLIGMTISSFNTVSLEPPLVLFSIDRQAQSLAGLQQAKGWAVNLLAREQKALSSRFARAQSDKWADVPHQAGHENAPLLAGALAQFECVPYAQYDGGDHVIFVGRVVRYNVQPQPQAPLIFFRSHYHEILAAP